MAGSFVLALLSKEQALTLPLLAALYEHFFREDRAETTRVQKVMRYGALWLLGAVYLALRARYLGGFAPHLERAAFGTKDLVIAALALFGRYCWKLVWPAELCAYYLFPTHVAVLYPWALGGAAALAICALTFVVLWKSNRQAAFGVVWVLATLGPGVECPVDDQQPLCGALPLSCLGGILLDSGLGRCPRVEFAFGSRQSMASGAARGGRPHRRALYAAHRHSKSRLAG